MAFSATTLFVLSSLCPAQHSAATRRVEGPASTHFVHGFWFNGSEFKKGDFYAVGGSLTHRAPKHLDETVDLHGGYVVPPFGDAHEHNFDSVANTPEVTGRYLRDGIFYGQGVTNDSMGARAVRAAGLVNTPTTIDVTYAQGGLTATNGHPKEIYERYALGFYNYPVTVEQTAKIQASHLQTRNAYWEIDTSAQLDAVWPEILAQKPDLIKVYLLTSERFAEEDHIHPALGKGLDPAMIPLITAKAHAAGLKVVAHVDTAADFHNALAGNVDEMAHLPGYYIAPGMGAEQYRIRDADVVTASGRMVKVIATANLSDNEYSSAAEKSLIRATEIDNLSRLKKAGVVILVGSDNYIGDASSEVTYLHRLGLWTNLELLRMYAVQTPEDIFPKRKIAHLQEGYEANFLVLQDDPLDRWEATTSIASRWKHGRLLTVAAEKATETKP